MSRYASCYFSPNRGTADLIIGFIDRCKETIDAAVYSITHDGIADALIRAHNRGVEIRVLMDNTQAANRYADDERMIAAGIPLRLDLSSAAFHHKFVIGDKKAVGTGSFNWTKNADTRNAENFVIIRLSYVVTEFQAEFEYVWEKNDPANEART